MSIRKVFNSALLTGFCAIFSFGVLAQEKKNLLFIITDQQRYDALSIAGNSVIKTPNLDRLASQGAFFQNAYSPSAVCCPSRSSILTGHTIENTGMNNNDAYYDVDERKMAMPTFDEILTEQGYHCEYYGKWHTSSYKSEPYKNPKMEAENGKSVFGPGGQSYVYLDYLHENEDNRPLQDGEFFDLITKYPYKSDPLDKYHGMTNAELEAKNLKHSQPDQHGELKINSENTMTAYQAKETINAIERLKDKPFSITCSFHFPHSPMLPAAPYYDMYPNEDMVAPLSISDNMQNSPYNNANGRNGNTDYADPQKIKYMISNYYGLITEIDDWTGKILDKLEELGLAESTLVIFTSDHGEMLGAHGMREKNVFYEESSHIPLLIRFPGEIEPQTTVEGYNSLIDIFPTILDYLKIPEHESNGKSLRGLIEGTDEDHGKYVVTEWDFRGDGESNYMIVRDGWKLIMPYTITSKVINAMYDLSSDPYEMNNLLGSNPDREQHQKKAEELRAFLLEWLAEHNSKHYYSVSKRDLLNGGKPTGNNAAFVSQNLPNLVPGETVSVSVTMRNTGTTAWTKEGNFKLASQSPAGNKIWGLDQINLDGGENIAPDAEKTFTFNIKVPAYDGSFNFQWQMIQEAEDWFGRKSEIEQIVIGDPGSYLDACDEKTDWKSSQALALNTTVQKQGSGCVEFSGNGTDEYKKIFSTRHDANVTAANGVLRFWYYVSDPSMLSDKNQVEIGSSGKPDENEYSWKLSGLSEGWNFVSLELSDAGKTGSPNLSAINWFRLYNKKSGSIISRIDAIQIVDKTATSSWDINLNSPELAVNIYPNPLSGNLLSIDIDGFDNSNNVEVRITNLLGQTVYNNTIQNTGHAVIDVSGWLKQSVYIVTIKSGLSIASKKLIVE